MGIHRPHRYGCQILLIVDHDTRRFTVEGPLYDHLPWIEEVRRARHAGRRIDFRAVERQSEVVVMQMGRDVGYECWPPGSIIRPALGEDEPAEGSVRGSWHVAKTPSAQATSWQPQES
jgi:hypothetical protein